MGYLCRFDFDDPEDVERIEHAFDHEGAAEQYAEHCQSDRDCWELSNEWGEEYEIVVMDEEDGSVERFTILREYEPVFSATKQKERWDSDTHPEWTRRSYEPRDRRIPGKQQ